MHSTLIALADIARQNHGVVSIGDARARGVSAVQAHRWVERGALDRIGRRGLTFPGQPQTWKMSLRSALINVGPQAVVSHRSAARLLQFEGFDEGPIELVVPRQLRNRSTEGVVVHSGVLLAIDRAEVGGFPCTRAARTIVDLAGSCSRRELENAIDSAVANRLVSVECLQRRLALLRHSGRSGVRLLDDLLPDSGETNRLERRFLQMCRQAGLPRPACQVTHTSEGKFVARVDFDFCAVEGGGRSGRSDCSCQPPTTTSRCGPTARADSTRQSRPCAHLRGSVRERSRNDAAAQDGARAGLSHERFRAPEITGDSNGKRLVETHPRSRIGTPISLINLFEVNFNEPE